MSNAAILSSDEAKKIDPSDARYIKLGAGGAWEETSLSGGLLQWGNAGDPHEPAAAGDWAGLHARYIAMNLPQNTATAYVREARDFYDGGREMLWITFSGGYLWWAFAEPEVVDRAGDQGLGHAARYRRVIGAWSNEDLKGRKLRIEDLSTKLTRLAAYRQTICSVAEKDYLFRRIRGDAEPAVEAALSAREGLASALLPLIQQLHQNDFELFTDLLFGAMGWRRRSMLGGTMKDIDLLLELPATGQRACVQVKSAADQKLADACITAMRAGWPEERAIFVCHTLKGKVAVADGDDQARLMDGPDLARAAVDHGLANWLLDKAA